MEISGFFDSEVIGHNSDGTPIYDREYLAEFFARYFSSFIGNGVFPNPATGLQVVAIDNNMQIRIKQGLAWINGYFYENTDDLVFKIDIADGVLDRADRVVLRLDFLERKIKAVVKKGEWSSLPKPKELQRDADAYEIALAEIKVSKGAIKIVQANITDLRLNKELCGIVHGTVDQVDTTAIFNQFQSWYSHTKNAYDKDVATWTTEKKEAFDAWYKTNTTEFLDKINNWYNTNTIALENDFNSWFATIKGRLDGDIAAKLTAKTIELEEKIDQDKKDLVNFKESVDEQLSDMATKTEVKAAQSRADSAYSLANSKQDKLTISSSTTSTSTTQVANSYAVKEAMDKANSAYDKSEQAFQLGDSTRKDVVSILSSKKLEGLTINSSWEQIKNALQNMSLGKKWANGTQYIDGSKGSFYVSALAFQPSFIIVLVSGSTYSKSVAYAFGQKVGGDEISSVYMLPDGFSVSTSKRYYFNDDNIQWIAFE